MANNSFLGHHHSTARGPAAHLPRIHSRQRPRYINLVSLPAPDTNHSLPETTGFVDLVVKKYPNGALSTHLHDMTPGQSVLFAGPLTRYQWKADNAHPHVAMVAGGTGICPMWQLLHGIFANPADRTKVTLVWGVNNDRELFLRDELAALQRRFPDRLRVVYAVSNPLPGSPHAAGRVTREVLEKAGLGRPERSTKLFLCGPPAMEKAVGGSWNFGAKDGILRELGYEKGQVERL